MEGYSSSYSSSSNSPYSFLYQNHSEAKRLKQTYPLQSQYWLHSIRRSHVTKPWKKLPVAPAMPPKPTKVYKVDALNFKELVQQLTGACDPVAVSPNKNLLCKDMTGASPPPVCTTNNWYYQDFQSEAFGMNSQENTFDGVMAPTASYSNNYWCSFPPLSPGTITSLELNSVL